MNAPHDIDPDQQAASPGRLTREFLAFHRENPHVYRVLVAAAREWKAAGHEKAAIDMVFNEARWRIGIKTTGSAFRLNDHHRAFYSRAIMHFEKDLDGIFDLRSAPEADAWIAQYKDGAAA